MAGMVAGHVRRGIDRDTRQCAAEPTTRERL
jgi:hypothetical protein